MAANADLEQGYKINITYSTGYVLEEIKTKLSTISSESTGQITK